jgi:hypothetical protein
MRLGVELPVRNHFVLGDIILSREDGRSAHFYPLLVLEAPRNGSYMIAMSKVGTVHHYLINTRPSHWENLCHFLLFAAEGVTE